jgi:tetratricopeptide (TPR) repeat protein
LGDGTAERNALLHLTKAHAALGHDDKALELAEKGIELSRSFDVSAASAFYQAKIEACYRTHQSTEAHIATAEAIELSREAKDFHREIDLLLSLGESYLASDLAVEALDVYQSALDAAKKLNRLSDEAYLTGRIGIVLAELGRLDEATTYHSRAVELARERNLPELEGEQLSMLAFVCRDVGDLENAREFCQAAIEVFSRSDNDPGVENARRLLAELES